MIKGGVSAEKFASNHSMSPKKQVRVAIIGGGTSGRYRDDGSHSTRRFRNDARHRAAATRPD